MRFSAKQAAFIAWYCSADVNCNATEAARRAGYKGNENTLGTVGFQNMQKPAIRNEIDKRMSAALAGAKVTVERVLIDLQRKFFEVVRGEDSHPSVEITTLPGSRKLTQ